MNDHFRQMNDAELEGVLRGLDAQAMFPPTPDFAAQVGDRLREERGGDTPAPDNVLPLRQRLAVAAAIAILIAGAIALAIPASRETIAGWFGLRSVNVVQVTATPDLPITPIRLDLGQEMPLDRAQLRVDYDILVPSLQWLGQPDETYYDEWPPGGQVALVYEGRGAELPDSNATGVGLLFTQFEASLNDGAFTKGIPAGTTVEQVSVGGGNGLWIEGDLHLFFYTDREGNMNDERIRLAGNVLVWEAGGIAYRLESSLPRDRVFQIAESLVPYQPAGD